MPITFVSGDPFLTQAQILAFGHNAKGRTEIGTFETALLNRYPAPFATHRRKCQKNRVKSGEYWLWRETKPHLMFMVIRESSVSATRLRYVQAVALTIARSYQMQGYKSIAIAPLGNKLERPEIHKILEVWLRKISLPVIVYEDYLPDVQADEGL